MIHCEYEIHINKSDIYIPLLDGTRIFWLGLRSRSFPGGTYYREPPSSVSTCVLRCPASQVNVRVVCVFWGRGVAYYQPVLNVCVI